MVSPRPLEAGKSRGRAAPDRPLHRTCCCMQGCPCWAPAAPNAACQCSKLSRRPCIAAPYLGLLLPYLPNPARLKTPGLCLPPAPTPPHRYDTRKDVKFEKDAPVIGLVLQRSHLVTGDHGHYDGVVAELEARGAKASAADACCLGGSCWPGLQPCRASPARRLPAPECAVMEGAWLSPCVESPASIQ